MLDRVEIRPMKESDSHEVYEIEKSGFPDFWSEDSFMDFRNPKGRRCFVAESEGKIAAYCVTMAVLDECEILKVAVSKEFRRKGFGEKLLREVMGTFKENGTNFFFLEVRESNIPALNLYKKLGFLETGRRAAYYRNPEEDAVLMSCAYG